MKWNTPVSELRGRGYRLEKTGKNGFAMFMPNTEIEKFSANDLLDEGIMQEVKRRFCTSK